LLGQQSIFTGRFDLNCIDGFETAYASQRILGALPRDQATKKGSMGIGGDVLKAVDI
jgi:hypothetical protein